jgi:hypothetical protein
MIQSQESWLGGWNGFQSSLMKEYFHICVLQILLFSIITLGYRVIIVGNVARIVFIRSNNSALHPACSSQHAIFTSTGFA